MRTDRSRYAIVAAGLVSALGPAAHPVAARQNIDLSTVPPRDTVQLTIYNSEDLTLVRETRTVTFKSGVNPLQFSWANTLIDPSSVQLRFNTRADQLELLDTTYPHDKPQELTWNVRSGMDGDAAVEITYFTSGLTWAADYVCVANTEETRMAFDGFVRITNNSGEDYDRAQVRLVVGTLNLVEKIADLARRGLISPQEERAHREGRMPASKFKDKKAKGEVAAKAMQALGYAEAEEKQIIKQGLSEYFIFTIPGTESIPHAWSKRMRLFSGTQAPLRIQYRYRPQEYGDQLVRMFLLRNDEKSSLGTTPLPDGVVRLFRDNGRDGQALLAQQSIKYVPIGQEIELNLGADQEVIHEHVRLRAYRDNLWFERSGANVHYSPTQGHRIEIDDRLVGWDAHEAWTDRVRNYRDRPIQVELRRSFDGDVVFHSLLSPVSHDFQTVQFTSTVQPAERKDLTYRVTTRNGINQKERHVTLSNED